MGWAEALQALGKDLTALPQTMRQREQLELEKQLRPLQIQAQQQQLSAAQQQQALASRNAELGEAQIATEGVGFDRPLSLEDPAWQTIAKTPYAARFTDVGGQTLPGTPMQMDAQGGMAPGGDPIAMALMKQKAPSFNEAQLIKQEENARRAAEAQQKIAQGLARIQQGDVRNDQNQQRIGISQANADSLALYRDALKAGLEAGQGRAPAYNNQVQWVTDPATGQEVLKPVSDILAGGFTRGATADMRNRVVARKQALPIISKIRDLSAKINTNHGIMATVKGGIEAQKAKVNLSNDMAQYISVVSMFTPLLARAVGHVGVLTEQDVQSVKAGLPTATDSQELALAKLSNVMSIMDAVNEALMNDANYGAAPPAPNGAGAAPPVAPPGEAPPSGTPMGTRRQTRDGRTVEWDGNGWRLVQ